MHGFKGKGIGLRRIRYSALEIWKVGEGLGCALWGRVRHR